MFGKCFKESNLDLTVITKIDNEGFPYGNKNLSWLKARLLILVEECKSDVVLIACNTLSSVIYLEDLKFKKKVVDVITPTIYFFREHNYKKICILATKNTILMDVYGKLLNNIYYIEASELIFNLEKNLKYDLYNIISKIDKQTDAILLGCTHLIAIKDEFRRKIGIDVISQEEIVINLLKKSFSLNK